MTRFLLIPFVLAGVLVITPTPTTHACSVMEGWPPSGVELLVRKDAVFIGTVTSIIQDRSMMGEFRVTFDVAESFKGDVGDSVIIRVPSSSAACGYDDGYAQFKEGTVWTIFAAGSSDEGYRTDGISLNESFRTVREAREALAAIGITNEPTACTLEYRPVCGISPEGKEVTYGNMCAAAAEKGTFKHDGECGPEGTAPTRDLSIGSRGADVTWLQEYLIARAHGTAVTALEAAGATGYFGTLTRAALAEFQARVSISPAHGYFGPITRAYLSAIR